MENKAKAPKDIVINKDNVSAMYHAIQKKLVTAVWKDESLRAKLLKNPQATIEQLVGHKFEKSLKIRIVDAAEGTVTFFLPHKKEKILGQGEFSETQLDAVAGGTGAAVLGGLGVTEFGPNPYANMLPWQRPDYQVPVDPKTGRPMAI